MEIQVVYTYRIKICCDCDTVICNGALKWDFLKYMHCVSDISWCVDVYSVDLLYQHHKCIYVSWHCSVTYTLHTSYMDINKGLCIFTGTILTNVYVSLLKYYVNFVTEYLFLS
jgi:hypothetical protein